MKPCYQELLDWANEELETGNRIKASRIYKVAMRVKERYEIAEEKRMNEMESMYF
jgi:hypothetical protein